MPSLNSWYWRFLENYVYAVPEPPPRQRTKPMQVLCVGPPRSGTESLQTALLTLGYDHTYHGWDIVYENPLQRQSGYGSAERNGSDLLMEIRTSPRRTLMRFLAIVSP
ncbi:hypothetical protein NXS19_006470 [Fusarium pseudograminearum]|nr:hypothetical protein NXS19_006470 [Fusarium pseudograminearum]